MAQLLFSIAGSSVFSPRSGEFVFRMLRQENQGQDCYVVTVPVQGLRPQREMQRPARTHALSVTVISLLTIYPLYLILLNSLLSPFKFEIHGLCSCCMPSFMFVFSVVQIDSLQTDSG